MSVNGMVRPTSGNPGVASVCRGRQWFSVLGGNSRVFRLDASVGAARCDGKPVTQYLEEKIWQLIGTENDATWILDVSGQETSHELISASLRDWARLGRLLANDGNWVGQVIPKKWIFATTVHEEFLAPGKLYRDHPEFDLGHGYLTWIILPGPERRMFAMMGTRGQIVVIDPKTKLVMVQTAVRKNFVEPWTEVFALWRGVLRAFGQN